MINSRVLKIFLVFQLVFAYLTGALSFGSTSEAVKDTKPPLIKFVRFDDKTYFPGDIIAPQVKITTLITDEGTGVSSIEIFTDSSLLYSGGPGPIYDPSTGNLEFTLSSPQRLSPGTYEVFIKATDFASNVTIEVLTDLKVLPEQVTLTGPYFSPIAFEPSLGAKISISFNLSASSPLSILIYSGAGDQVFSVEYKGKEGLNVFTWDGRSAYGKVLQNGYYSLKIMSGNRVLGSGKFLIED